MSQDEMTRIYEEYSGRVMGYICARVRSRADAEDLCQDVFEKVSRKLDGFDPKKASISTWIYAITRNRVIDFYRTSRSHSELDENLAEDGELDEGLLNDETLEELAEALNRLPPELRKSLVMRYYDGLTLTEIARAINVSYGMTKIRHNKALNALRNALYSRSAL